MMTVITLSNYNCPTCGTHLEFEGREISGGLDGDRIVSDVYRCPGCSKVRKLCRTEDELNREYVRVQVDRLVAESRFAVSPETRAKLEQEAGKYLKLKTHIQAAFTRDQSFLTEDFYQRSREIIMEGVDGYRSNNRSETGE